MRENSNVSAERSKFVRKYMNTMIAVRHVVSSRIERSFLKAIVALWQLLKPSRYRPRVPQPPKIITKGPRKSKKSATLSSNSTDPVRHHVSWKRKNLCSEACAQAEGRGEFDASNQIRSMRRSISKRIEKRPREHASMHVLNEV